MKLQRASRGVRAHLRFEQLESRDCPAVSFQNDYSQDVNGFFTPQRRALLEYAEQQLMPYLQDNLSAIVPNPVAGDTWSISFQNTATRQNVIIQNPTIPANVIRVYAWGIPQANFARPTILATTGEVGYDMRGRRSWTDTVIARGQLGRLATPVVDTSVTAIRMDVNQDAHYYESTTPPPDGSLPDMVTMFEHELLHPLGFNAAAIPATARWVNAAGQFTGPHVEALAGGPVQMDASHAHWAPGTMSNGVLALMTPTITNKRLTPLATALLADVGWQTGLPDPPPELVVQGSEAAGNEDQTSRVVGGLTRFAVSQDDGGVGVQITNSDGKPALVVSPFPEFGGGVRSAMGDFNGDGIPDLVVGTGPGILAQVRVLDGRDAHDLFDVTPFANFTGGVFVAAGDLNGDGIADLVISPDEGGGPRIRAFNGKANFSPLVDFLGIADPNFRGGARVAIGDVNGDGVGDLIVAAGTGGGPRVSGYDGRTLATGNRQKVFPDFFAFEQTLRNGVFVAAGDVDGDGFADLVLGGGPGGGPRVLTLGGHNLLSGQLQKLGDFFAGDTNSRGGIRVTTKDLNNDGRDDIIVGAGEDAGSRVTAYDSSTLHSNGVPSKVLSFEFTPGFQGGSFVG